MDLDAAAEDLYALSPEEFVGRRTALVAAARAAKDRELAKAIGALRRPTRSAWLVNVLAREARDDVGALLDLAPAFTDAQRRGSGADLRALAAQRRTVVDALARRAVALAAERGYTAPDGAQQEVAQTLQAALGDAEVGELVRRGQLIQAVTYAGFGPTLSLVPDLAPEAAAAESGEAAVDTASKPRSGDENDDATGTAEEPPAAAGPDPALVAAATEARRAADDAQAALTAAEGEAEASTGRADELADRVEALHAEVAAAVAAERTARDEARTARRALGDLRRAAADTQQRAIVAEAALGQS